MSTKLSINFADICEINIRAASHVFLDENWQHKSSCSPFSRMYYVKDGEGYLRINGRETKMRGDMCILFRLSVRLIMGV